MKFGLTFADTRHVLLSSSRSSCWASTYPTSNGYALSLRSYYEPLKLNSSDMRGHAEPAVFPPNPIKPFAYEE